MTLDDIFALAALRYAGNTAQRVAKELGDSAPEHRDELAQSAQAISDEIDAYILEIARGAPKRPDPPTP